MHPAPVLTTARLSLRPLAPRDCVELFEVMRDPLAMRFWDSPPLQDFSVCRDIIASQIAQMQAGRALYWAVCLFGQDTAIGSCDLSEIDRQHRRAETGFLFHPAWWGNGYAYEAMNAVISHAFARMELERIWARLHAGNSACMRLLDRLGFSFEGRLSGHVVRDGARRDCLIYGKLRGD